MQFYKYVHISYVDPFSCSILQRKDWCCWKIVKVFFLTLSISKIHQMAIFLYVCATITKHVVLFQNVTAMLLLFLTILGIWNLVICFVQNIFTFFYFLAYLEFFVAKFLFKRRKMMYWTNTYSANHIYVLFRNKSFALNFWTMKNVSKFARFM